MEYIQKTDSDIYIKYSNEEIKNKTGSKLFYILFVFYIT